MLAQSGVQMVLCFSPAQSLVDGFTAGLAAQIYQISPGLLALEWGLMVLAMMLPLTVPHLSVFCARLFRKQQIPALFAALCGFVLIWLAIGLVLIPIMLGLRALAAIEGYETLVILMAYGAAIGWSWSPWRQAAFKRCHWVPVIYGKGWPAMLASGLYGLRLGLLCLATCVFAMIAPMLAGQGVLAMALVTHVLLMERLSHRPRPIHTALPLAMIGVLAFL